MSIRRSNQKLSIQSRLYGRYLGTKAYKDSLAYFLGSKAQRSDTFVGLMGLAIGIGPSFLDHSALTIGAMLLGLPISMYGFRRPLQFILRHQYYKEHPLARDNCFYEEACKMFLATPTCTNRYWVVILRGQDTKPSRAVLADRAISQWLWKKDNDAIIGVVSPNYSSLNIFGESILGVIIDYLHRKCQANQIVFNDAKIRLSSDLDPAHSGSLQTVKVQRTSYFDSIISHESMPRKVFFDVDSVDEREIHEESARTCRRIFDSLDMDGRVETIASPPNALVNLSESELSNHFGTNTIVFHRKLGFIVQRQSSRNAQSAGELVCSGSGSSDWFARGNPLKFVFRPKSRLNAQPGGSFRQLLADEAIRELAEETQLRLLPIDSENIEITGFSRNLDRGAKPDFYFFLRLPDNYADTTAQIMARVSKTKELLFVDNLISDLVTAIVKPEELDKRCFDGDFAVQQAAIAAESSRLLSDATLYDKLKLEVKSIFQPTEFITYLLMADEANWLKRDLNFWVRTLRVLESLPESSPALRCACRCVRERLAADTAFGQRLLEPYDAPVETTDYITVQPSKDSD